MDPFYLRSALFPTKTMKASEQKDLTSPYHLFSLSILLSSVSEREFVSKRKNYEEEVDLSEN